jgi:hypothetical protein
MIQPETAVEARSEQSIISKQTGLQTLAISPYWCDAEQ